MIYIIKTFWLTQLIQRFFWGDLKLFYLSGRNCNKLLTKTVVQLERNTVRNAQYHRRESVEVNPVPPSINDEELEVNICKALSLTGHEVKPDDLQACHRLKKKESVIVKFKCRKLKWSGLVNRTNLGNKSENLLQLSFLVSSSIISESMCHENHQLAYRCRQLKNAHNLVLEQCGKRQA